MKKRISIQYSIDESNVAHECYRLLNNTLTRLTSIAATAPPTESIVNPTTMREIRSLRDELSEIDIELGDVNAIIDGFLDYQYSSKPQEHSTQSQQKIDIPNFSDQPAGDVNLDQLSSFVAQLKGATPENFDMEQVAALSNPTENTPTPDIDPEKVNEIVETFKNTNLEGVDPQDIFNTLSMLQAGPAKFDEIGERLKILKDRVDSSEVTD